jgi:membrane-bound inhibitor of C-type lysozyme
MAKKIFGAAMAGIFMSLALVAALTLPASAAKSDKNKLEFVHDGNMYMMKRVESASGEKYEAPGDLKAEFWSNGGEAMFTIGGKDVKRYVLIRETTKKHEIMLTVDGKNFLMKEVAAASGVKYQCADSKNTTLWTKGNDAMLTVKGKDYDGYELQPAGRFWIEGE